MSNSQLNCLIEMMRLSEQNQYVASVSVAKRLHISKPSAHRLLDGLKKMGYIEKNPYGAANLTEMGKQIAAAMHRKAQELSAKLSDSIVSKEFAYQAALLLLANLDKDSFVCFDSEIKLGEEQ